MMIIGKILQFISDALRLIGRGCLVGMMLLTCVDVIGRKFGYPIFGSVELVGFMATLAVAFALPYTHQVKAHIGVEVLIQTLSQKTQAVIELCTHLVSLALFSIVTWQMFLYADTIHSSGTVSMSLELPEHVIIYVVAVCFLIFSLVIVKDIAVNVQKLRATR